MEIETIACKWHFAPKMLCTLKGPKSNFFQILREGEGNSLLPKKPREVIEAETIEELQKLKGEFVREFSGFLSYLGHRGDCCYDTYPPEKKRKDPQAGVIRLFFSEQEKAYHLLFNEFQFFDETTIGMSWFNQNE